MKVSKSLRKFIILILQLRNNGVCYQPRLGIFACSCPCGFTGYNCETRIYFCLQNSTYCNTGTCQETQPCSVCFYLIYIISYLFFFMALNLLR